MRKRRQERQYESKSRLEQIVREVMQRHAEEEAFNAGGGNAKTIRQTVIGFPRDKIYNRSYQEAMDRPISIISYDPSEFKV